MWSTSEDAMHTAGCGQGLQYILLAACMVCPNSSIHPNSLVSQAGWIRCNHLLLLLRAIVGAMLDFHCFKELPAAMLVCMAAACVSMAVYVIRPHTLSLQQQWGADQCVSLGSHASEDLSLGFNLRWLTVLAPATFDWPHGNAVVWQPCT